MKIMFITTDDPFHLPMLFETILSSRAKDTIGVVIVDPLYRGQTVISQAIKTIRSFGFAAFAREAQFYVLYKLLDYLSYLVTLKRFYSVERVSRYYSCRVYHVENINSTDFLNVVKSLAPDIIVSISPPQIMNKKLTNIPALGCINLHGSLLPSYRGILPTFWMLANDEKRGGITVHYINKGIDDGDIISQREYKINASDTLHSLISRSKKKGASLVLECLNDIENGRVICKPNMKSEGSYYSFPTREAYRRFRRNGRRIR